MRIICRSKMSDLKLVKKEKGYERNNCIFKFLNSDLVNVKLNERKC